MTYNFAICDDEIPQQDSLKRMVLEWAGARRFTARIACFPSAEAFLFHYEEDKSFDILLLDIEMAGINGVQLASAVRKDNKEVQIVFVTGYMDYIADGYDVEALHYLLKPVTEGTLYAVLDRAAIPLPRGMYNAINRAMIEKL